MLDLSIATEHQEIKNRITMAVYYKYTSEERKYHNIKHIFDMKNKLDDYLIAHDSKELRLTELKWAIILHDVVYDLPNLGPLSNENKSVNLFFKFILKNLPSIKDKIDILLVANLIESTDYFDNEMCAKTDDDVEYFILHDLDFSSLGEDWKTFQVNNDNIRQEHWYVSDEEYAIGRKAFLSNMLEKEQIFFLPYFVEKYEERARKNLTKALESL